jgi:antitoxin component of MazEF toxin-antitoxin module
MATEVITRKWGNSIGVILPNELVQTQNIKENQKIIINVVKEADISHMFGSLKGKLKLSGQELKDMAREGWD